MQNLTVEQEMMRLRQVRLRGRKKPRYQRRPLQLNTDAITEMQLRVKLATYWLEKDMSITAIVEQAKRPQWWVQDWINAGCPLFDFPRGKQL